MDKDAIIKQLKDAIDQFKRETELLKGRIKELEAKLAMYENAHTPPSLRLLSRLGCLMSANLTKWN